MSTRPHKLVGGLCFFDNSWGYHGGTGEERIDKALASGGRCDRHHQNLPDKRA